MLVLPIVNLIHCMEKYLRFRPALLWRIKLGSPFCIKWVDEGSIIAIIKNTYEYVHNFIDKEAPGGKEHVGYIVDRTGYQVFKTWALKDVILNPQAEVATCIYW